MYNELELICKCRFIGIQKVHLGWFQHIQKVHLGIQKVHLGIQKVHLGIQKVQITIK